jgi:hypothetical protein
MPTRPNNVEDRRGAHQSAAKPGRQSSEDFRRQAEEQPLGFFGELLYMIRRDKQWWLVPILLTLLVLAALVFLGGTAAAPFIYTLF